MLVINALLIITLNTALENVDSRHMISQTLSPRGGTPLFGLYGDLPLDRVWFFGLAVLNTVYNLPLS